MRKKEKLLSFLLCLVLLTGIAVLPAGAAYSDADQIVHTQAVDTLTELGILNGKEDGSYFEPDSTLTRAEFCKMLVLILNGGKEPELPSEESYSLSDIQDHWAAAYIAYCWNLGLVAGGGDGTFDPDGTVTGSQAAKMLLCAIGYDSANEGFTGETWAIAVNVRANQRDFYENLENLEPRESITRDDAAQLVYNAMNAVMVTYDYKLAQTAGGELVEVPVLKELGDGQTLLSNYFQITTESP